MIVSHLCALFLLSGVFGVDADEVKSVMEGDSVTLHTHLTDIQRDDHILWMFEFHNTLIAEIYKQNVIMHDSNEIFGGRLKLDSQTGSLSITNIRLRDSGLYQLQISSNRGTSHKRFSVTVYGVFGADADEVKSVMEGDSVTLYTDLTHIQRDDQILWMFEFHNTLIAEIYKQNVIMHDSIEIFGDRLKVDSQTGSLTITNIRLTDSGLYQLQISSDRGTSYKRFSVTVYGVFGADADEVKSVMEGDSVTLHTHLTHIQTYDHILWMFGLQETRIAEIYKRSIDMFDSNKIFGDRLKLDSQTGSLTITNIIITDSGLYRLHISSDRGTSYKRFSVTVYDSSQCSSSSERSSVSTCVLLCSVMNVTRVSLSWYKGKSLLSSISVSDLNIRLSLPLEVEYQDTNTYRCVINNPITNHTQHLHITELCGSCTVKMSKLGPKCQYFVWPPLFSALALPSVLSPCKDSVFHQGKFVKCFVLHISCTQQV
ncbi:putative CD48 antigen-like [Triplophysa rosa]|uniref:CD48 antigen-like n=1 Tax=Triplophysa rosa TaxID=992332 RepID=A0A9W7T465_TRIRA|nr:putative CD48 antigen-like [Triplophysa rosa]